MIDNESDYVTLTRVTPRNNVAWPSGTCSGNNLVQQTEVSTRRRTMSTTSRLRRSPPSPVKQTNLYVDVNYMRPKSMFIAEAMNQDEEEDTGEDTDEDLRAHMVFLFILEKNEILLHNLTSNISI